MRKSNNGSIEFNQAKFVHKSVVSLELLKGDGCSVCPKSILKAKSLCCT